jgi:flagellar hook-associated protein 1 FlgK
MSLFGSIRIAANTLRADQIAMQVIGQNIANANTPGYIREEVVLQPAPTQRKGGLLLGLGVDVKAVVQKVDAFLEERLRGAVSEKAGNETKETIYTQLEQIIGELKETDVSTAMTQFFSSIEEILNQPEDVSVRNLAVLNGSTLTQEIQQLSQRVRDVRLQVNDRVTKMTGEINNLIERVRVLNIRIAETEGGSVSQSDAVGLRDQRLQALEDLAGLINIRVEEQPSGTVTVYTGGEYLVADGNSRPVTLVVEADRGIGAAYIHMAGTDSRLKPDSGELAGLLSARDDVLAGFLDGLDEFATTLGYEFNRIFTSGQGLKGNKALVSDNYVMDADAALNSTATGLRFTPSNGSFQVLIYDTKTKTTQTADIRVNLNGVAGDPQTTLTSLTKSLNEIAGNPLTATVTPEGRLSLKSNSPINEFAFANDTSGALASLGLGTFFTGTSALDMGVNSVVKADPAKFAASQGGIGADTKNAIELADFLDKPIAAQNGSSIALMYDQLVGTTTQGATVTSSAAEGARVFEQTLRGEKTSVSGVSIDEEAIQMIAFQHSFQASSRFIKACSDMLEMLVNI